MNYCFYRDTHTLLTELQPAEGFWSKLLGLQKRVPVGYNYSNQLEDWRVGDSITLVNDPSYSWLQKVLHEIECRVRSRIEGKLVLSLSYRGTNLKVSIDFENIDRFSDLDEVTEILIESSKGKDHNFRSIARLENNSMRKRMTEAKVDRFSAKEMSPQNIEAQIGYHQSQIEKPKSRLKP